MLEAKTLVAPSSVMVFAVSEGHACLFPPAREGL